MGRILFVAFAGGVGGIAGWAIMEPFAPTAFTPAWQQWEAIFTVVVGGLIGLAIGAANGWYQGSRMHFLRGAALGLLCGAIAGSIGLRIGAEISVALFGNVLGSPIPQKTAILARSVVFLFFGAFLGLGVGIAGLSVSRAIQGLIGGTLGGFAAGMTFDLASSLTQDIVAAAKGGDEVGMVGRAILGLALGLGIGLFIGVVAALSRRAWVRLEVGRNEGKEWVLDFPQAFVGRSETAHIPLFGDPNIAPMHARIDRVGGRFRLVDGGTPMGIGVNGIRVPSAELNHGDIINIGSYNLRFLTRGGSAVPIPADAPRAMQAQPIQQQAAPLPSAATMPTTIPMAVPAGVALVALDGPIAGQRFPLGPQETIVGREGNILVSFDSSASRRHASIIQAGNGAIVRDLGSTNGTHVNGVRVQEMTLRPGDTVTIGATTFRLE